MGSRESAMVFLVDTRYIHGWKVNKAKDPPPITPIARSLGLKPHEIRVRLTPVMPPEEALRLLLARPTLEPEKGRFGSWDDFGRMHSNINTVESLLRRLNDVLTEAQGKEGIPCERAASAAILLLCSSYSMDSATVAYFREGDFSPSAAGASTRTALELAGNAAFIATGTGDEVARWESGRDVTSDEQMAALKRILPRKNPKLPGPRKLYSRLSSFTHFNFQAIQNVYQLDAKGRAERREYVARAMAYTGWAIAETTLLVTGVARGPDWPHYFGDVLRL